MISLPIQYSHMLRYERPVLQPSMGGSPTAARFDLSGLYLAVGGTQAQVVGSKQEWNQLADLSGAIGKKVSTLRFVQSPALQRAAP